MWISWCPVHFAVGSRPSVCTPCMCNVICRVHGCSLLLIGPASGYVGQICQLSAVRNYSAVLINPAVILDQDIQLPMVSWSRDVFRCNVALSSPWSESGQSRALHLLGWLTWQWMDTQHNCSLNPSAKSLTSGCMHPKVQHSALDVPFQHWHEAIQLYNVLPSKALVRVCDDCHGASPEGRPLSRFVRKWSRMSSGQRKRRQKGRRHHLIHASSDIKFLSTASGQAAFMKNDISLWLQTTVYADRV